MKCERCQSIMREEQLVVSGGLFTVKNISAWHCAHCGRIEYRGIAAEEAVEGAMAINP